MRHKTQIKLTSFVSFILGVLFAIIIVLCSKPVKGQSMRSQYEMRDSVYKLILDNVTFHPDIVYCQAILETGWFKSKAFTCRNNLFGFQHTKDRAQVLHNYPTLEASIKAYAKWQETRYYPTEDYTNEEYFIFLKKVGYAKDTLYVQKLKKLHKQIFN